MLLDIKNVLPSAEIQVFPNSDMLSINQYLKFWHSLKKCDLFIFGGGQEIQDQASVTFLISGLLKIFLAKLHKKSVYCYALGVGPVRRKISKLLIRLVLNRVDLITVRDQSSRELLHNLKINKIPIHITADPAFNLEINKDTDVQNIFTVENIPYDNKPKIVFTLRRWFHYHHFFLPMRFRNKLISHQDSARFSNFLRIISGFIDQLVEIYSARIIFLPMRKLEKRKDPGQDDDIVISEITSLIDSNHNIRTIEGNYTPAEIKTFLGKTDLVFGMRMHSLLLASTMGVPVIGLNLSEKFDSFFKLINQQDYLIELENLTIQKLLNVFSAAWENRKIISKDLLNRKLILQKTASANQKFLLDLVGNIE